MSELPVQPVQRRAGRRTKLTPETRDRIITAVRAGATMEAAAGAAGIGESTLYRWLQEAEQPGAPRWKREFREDLLRARDELEVRLVAGSVMKAALGGYVVKRVTRVRPDGTQETEEQFAPADGRVGLEVLARRFHGRGWGRTPVEVSGPDGGPIQVAYAGAIQSLAARLEAELGVVDGEVVEGETV